MNFWTDEKLAKLRELVASKKYSGEQMANILGAASRNAVIGKVHRLGLSIGLTKKKNPKRKPLQIVRKAPNLTWKKPVQFTGKPVHLIELERYHCRYMVGDDLYCGQRTQDSTSYCKEHYEICYSTPIRPTRQRYPMRKR